jgi:hypothetical protein
VVITFPIDSVVQWLSELKQNVQMLRLWSHSFLPEIIIPGAVKKIGDYKV